jgi:hypothetical protein
MNPVETFSEFSGKLSPTDLMLYAGIGIVLWVLFKDKLSPVQKFIVDSIGNLKVKNNIVKKDSVLISDSTSEETENQDVFFDLVVSWKQTRDLAEKSGCTKAVEVADQMFPFLSPTICDKKEGV